MGGVQIVTATLALIISVVAVVLVSRTVVAMVGIIKLGQPDPSRMLDKGTRLKTMLRETLLHTRMLRWTVVGAAHWFVFVAFGSLLFTLIEAYGEVFSPTFEIPIIGEWTIYGLVMELIATLGL